jgi:hypothetical protein
VLEEANSDGDRDSEDAKGKEKQRGNSSYYSETAAAKLRPGLDIIRVSR